MLSPASPESSSLRNISTPVHRRLDVSLMPTISISSPTFTTPRSITARHNRPAPEIENTSSIGIRNGLVLRTVRLRDVLVNRRHQLQDRILARLLVAILQRRQRRAPITIGMSSPGKS